VTGGSSLASFLARRFALLLFTLILVPSLSFVMFTLLQGDQTAPVDVLRELGRYLSATFLQADLGGGGFRGSTFSRTQGVLDTIGQGFPADLYLLFGGMAVGLAFGLVGGVILGTRPRTFAARAVALVIAFVLASPVYWLGLLTLVLFAPDVGRIAEIPFLSDLGGYRPPTSSPLRFLQAMWVPWLVVGAPLAAATARMCAGQLGDVLGEDFLRTARGKGVSEAAVVRRHALPAAIVPVVALVGVSINLMITNVALMESVFNIPGSFRYIPRALINRDVDLVQGMVLEATFFIVVFNFLADAVQAWLDPRRRG
jgi:peptide/nickel transport system permease protein